MTRTATTTVDIPAWDDPRRAIVHALGCGPRFGWTAVEGTIAAVELLGVDGDGDAVTVTYTRGTGAARQVVLARFRMVDTGRGHAYRFVGGITGVTAARTWVAIMESLTSAPLKVCRAPRGTRPRR